jgi:nucleoside-diphosphate-sugar epimerase
LGLSLHDRAELRRNVTSVVHAAATYRLSARRDVLWQTNVDAVATLLDHVRQWPVTDFHHVSSITAAGDADGLVLETLLPRPRRFRNAYEESKWAAEATVLERARVPVRIYRPGIVIGHSRTGETQKFDGPYEAFGLMSRTLPFPIFGRGASLFPLVNVDLVAEVLAAGVACPPTEVEVVHVVDLDAPSVGEFARAMTRRLAGHARVIGLPGVLAPLLSALPGFERWTGLEAEACEYLRARTAFATTNLEQLCGSAHIDGRRVKGAYDVLALYYAVQRGRTYRAAA